MPGTCIIGDWIAKYVSADRLNGCPWFKNGEVNEHSCLDLHSSSVFCQNCNCFLVTHYISIADQAYCCQWVIGMSFWWHKSGLTRSVYVVACNSIHWVKHFWGLLVMTLSQWIGGRGSYPNLNQPTFQLQIRFYTEITWCQYNVTEDTHHLHEHILEYRYLILPSAHPLKNIFLVIKPNRQRQCNIGCIRWH